MVALSIWPRVLVLNLTGCPQPVVAFTFHTCVSQSLPRSRNRNEPDEEDIGPEDHNSGLRKTRPLRSHHPLHKQTSAS